MVQRLPSEQKAGPSEALDVLNPKLDGVYSGHSLYSKTSSAYGSEGARRPAMLRQAKTRPGWKPEVLPSLTTGTKQLMRINEDDFEQALHYDVLDLHRLTEGLYDRTMGNSDTQIPVFSEAEKKRNADTLSLASLNDRMLKAAYIKLGDTTTPLESKRKLRIVIQRLQSLPHLYKPKLREESTDIHVNRWLNRTQKPEPEMVGFASADPFEPRRFIADVKPRKSSSDTRVVLGKRKRVEMVKDEYDAEATDCGSDTLLTERRDCVRPLGAKRRRASRQELGI